MAKITAKQLVFINKFIELGNGTAAAKAALYSPHTANVIAANLLAKPHIKAAIQAQQQSIVAASKVTVEDIIKSTLAIRDHCAQVEAKRMISPKDALKANELVSRLSGFMVDKSEVNITSIKVVREPETGDSNG